MKMNKNNSFTSKADILKLLSSKVNLSKIELSFAFEVNDWIKNQDIVLRNIKKIFKKNIIIVRSSALDEDTVEKSGAGNYESVLFVNPTSKKQLIGAVSTVINSYKFKGSVNKKNQVLIQKQTLNSDLNGVIFTKTPKFGAPYFIINYKNKCSITFINGMIIYFF